MNRTLTILIFAFLCNSCEKDLVKTIDGSNVKASFNCLPETDIKVGQTLIFANFSENAENYVWYFGDGATSKDIIANHCYLKSGTFTVKLKASNSYSTDSLSKIITVRDLTTTEKVCSHIWSAYFIQSDILFERIPSDDRTYLYYDFRSNGSIYSQTFFLNKLIEKNGKWSISDSTITIKFDSTYTYHTIKELTNQSLKLDNKGTLTSFKLKQ